MRRATAAHLVQQLALHSQLPRGHLLRLLALRLAGRVRVGDVDPELSLLLSHRVERKNMEGSVWVKTKPTRCDFMKTVNPQATTHHIGQSDGSVVANPCQTAPLTSIQHPLTFMRGDVAQVSGLETQPLTRQPFIYWPNCCPS